MHLPHFYLSIHLSMDIWMVCIFVIVNNALNMGIQVTYLSPYFQFFPLYTQKWHCLQNIFVPLKGIHRLQFGMQHLHQNQKGKTDRIRLENQGLQCYWSRKPHRMCLSVGGHKSACEGLPLPCTRGCSPNPLLPHLMGWEFWVPHQKCAFIKEGFVGYRECSWTA